MAIERLCAGVEQSGRGSHVAAIGFIAPDDLFTVGAFLRFDEDLPPDAETYRLLSPVEWGFSDERSFDRLNRHLASARPSDEETDGEYRQRVRKVFDACASALERLDLQTRYGRSLYLTFAGVDPNKVLFEEEKRFVQRMNPPGVFEQWCNELE